MLGHVNVAKPGISRGVLGCKLVPAGSSHLDFSEVKRAIALVLKERAC
jgi:hypothetical protein